MQQKKHISKTFEGVIIDQHQLSSMSKRIIQATEEFGGELKVEITASNGEDTFNSNKYTVFHSSDLPKEIDRISIDYYHYNAPISCSIDFQESKVRLSVKGDDIVRISGLYQQLSSDLMSTQTPFWNLIKFSQSFIAGMLTLIVFGVGFFMFIAELSPLFITSESPYFPFFSLTLILVSFIVGFVLSIMFHNKVGKAFRGVRFSGKFKDKGDLKGLKIFIVSILSPIILSLIASYIFKFLDK